MGTRAAIYARVSTMAGQSPQMQLDALREYAARRELEVVAELVDHGVSGARDHRPALDRLMAAARQRQVDVILVYRFDRFARNVRHLVTALDEFKALGVDFVSYTESIDTSTPLGRALFAIVAALGELERSLIIERSTEGQRRARARGTHVGRPRHEVDADQVLELHRAGLRAIARATGLSRTVPHEGGARGGLKARASEPPPDRAQRLLAWPRAAVTGGGAIEPPIHLP